MKIVFSILIALSACASAATNDLPEAGEILRSVLGGLPSAPLGVSGSITVRKRHGVVERELRFDMLLRWGSVPSTAVYTIRDAFGAEIEQLTVTRTPGEPASYEYAAGSPPVHAEMPDLGAPVQGTDFSWLDLSLCFLWWTDGTVAGREVVRGRPCFMVDVRPPQDEKSPYSLARLWIDEEIRMMLRAEAYARSGAPARSLWIKSVKKINDAWMIKDMEIESYPLVHRTRLSVLEADREQL